MRPGPAANRGPRAEEAREASTLADEGDSSLRIVAPGNRAESRPESRPPNGPVGDPPAYRLGRGNERATTSRIVAARAAARLALAIEALMLPLVRLLRDQASRLSSFTEGAGLKAPHILRRSLLAYAAGLLAIGTGVAAGLVPRASALEVAAGRSKVALTDAASVASSRQDNLTGGERRALQPTGLGVATVAVPSPGIAAPGEASPPTTAASLPPPTYVNPLARGADLQPKRIDEGVDYAGAGPLLAMGSGTIRVTSSLAAGHAFIVLQLDKGPSAGRMVYYAENMSPAVSVGQHVNAGDVVGILHDSYPNLEIGWAGGGSLGGTLGNALARSTGGDVDGVSTAVGVNFSQLLAMLGAPSGIQQGLMGRLPASL